MKVLFLYLTAFSTNGGIEQFNKALMKVLSDGNSNFFALSSHDKVADTRYINSNSFKGFSGNKILFAIEAIAEAQKFDHIIIGHINLAPVGYLIMQLYPEKKISLVTHGIEVWGYLSGIKKNFISKVNQIITVSNFTRNILINKHDVAAMRIKILPNTIDPYFNHPYDFKKPEYLLKKYGYTDKDRILLTVARLSSKEQYKGHDMVIKAMPELIGNNPEIKYLIVGKYDDKEKQRIDDCIKRHQLENIVTLTGFVPAHELEDHYTLADVFVMPGKGEGFGIVYLEALACGIPVITGNKDAGHEILKSLPFGHAVDPDNAAEIADSISELLSRNFNKNEIQSIVIKQYGYDTFTKKVKNIIYNKKEEPAEA